jgi:ABC-2 type transport system ATP-binding protein
MILKPTMILERTLTDRTMSERTMTDRDLTDRKTSEGTLDPASATDLKTSQPSRDLRARPVVARLLNVSKTYGAVQALRQVSFDVRQGEILAVLGPNGAGKTTAVKLLLGLAGASAGSVSVFGGDPRNPSNRLRTGAMLQVARVPETLRVREHIELFSSYYTNPLPIADTLAAAGLTQLATRKFGDLSGGQKQRVLFALAICGDPDLLFLDEATLGLDVEARRLLWDQIRSLASRGKAVLLTTHYLQEADALADRILVINRGEIIAEGSPVQIKARTGGRQIRCHTALSLSQVRAIAGVLDAKVEGDSLVLQTSVPEPVLRELLARDSHLSGLEVTSAGLEEAFLALTSNQESNGRQS